MPYTSIHGRRFGYNDNGLLFDGRPVGADPQAYGFGNTFYVDSGVAGSDGTSPSTALATLEAAINKCTADQGDLIIILPGHAESIASATALNFDVGGIRIEGLGEGANRPTFTFTTANTATIPVSANGITIRNCIFVGNFLSIASCFTVAAAADFWIDQCVFRDTDATHGFLSIVTTTVSVNSDGLRYTNNQRKSDATTSPGPDIVIANTMSRLKVLYNKSVHTVASNNIAALIEHGALVMTDAEVIGNFVYSVNTDTATGAVLLKTTATTGSGIVASNRVRTLDAAAAILVPVAAVQYAMFDNLHNDGATFTSGYLLPAVGAD